MSKSAIIEDLQTGLSMELAAVLQYQMHAHVAEDWGFDRLAAEMREEMHEELGHADAFIRRIMFLGGDPVLKPAKIPSRAQSAADMFSADLADEEDAIKFYTKAALAAEKAGDLGTRRLFENTALDEEGHKSWLETQLALLEKLGGPAFLARQIGADTSEEASG